MWSQQMKAVQLRKLAVHHKAQHLKRKKEKPNI
jgi:hypothetical protein